MDIDAELKTEVEVENTPMETNSVSISPTNATQELGTISNNEWLAVKTTDGTDGNDLPPPASQVPCEEEKMNVDVNDVKEITHEEAKISANNLGLSEAAEGSEAAEAAQGSEAAEVPEVEVRKSPIDLKLFASAQDEVQQSPIDMALSAPAETPGEVKKSPSDLELSNSSKPPAIKEENTHAGHEPSNYTDVLVNDKKPTTANLRKNIRELLDENHLDAHTLNAQREESERLARVVEQQKLVREHQRQTVANKVLSLLQSTRPPIFPNKSIFSETSDASNNSTIGNSLVPPFVGEQTRKSFDETSSKEKSDLPSSVETQVSSDVVTIDDSSSDDCILLSDDENDDDEEFVEEIYDDPANSGLHVKDAYNVVDESGRVVVNMGHPDEEEDIFLAPQIAKVIKPHQIGGIRFLFDNIIESIKRFQSSMGFGCILAHSMGLGKTLQVVSFCDIFLRHTDSKTILCIMPINTLQNWLAEFDMWTPRFSEDPTNVRPRTFDVFVLNDQQKTLGARAKVIHKWSEQGGVLLMGYELFRLLAMKMNPTRKRRKNCNSNFEEGEETVKPTIEKIYQALVKPGPDLVICDEGHRIKNLHAGISVALKQIRTRRRIVLTGYPLQNNLLEYWCMVDFVRPNYLGTRTEFCNMFERPIQNGQCIDSTPGDIKLMRFRAHVLHSLLVGFVQRRSHVILQQTLPTKSEYVVLTRMTDFQRQLYDTFMNDVVRTKTIPNPLKAFAVCCKIWNHPDVLYDFLKKGERDIEIETDVNDIPPPPVAPKSCVPIKSENIFNEEKNTALTANATPSPIPTKAADVTNNFSMGSNAPFNQNSEINNGYNNFFGGDYFNYWNDSAAPYSSNIGAPCQPDYVGMMINKSSKKAANTTDYVSTSSEIVDLDTKEIKTVKTDITPNPIINENCLKKSEEQNVQNQSSPNQNINKTSILKEPLKVKSDECIPYEWAIELMQKYQPGLIKNSPKMEIFFYILNECVKLGERILVFSQSLLTLNLIEKFLNANYLPDSDTYWTRNLSYFRLDGSTTSQEREKLVNEFNANTSIKLFLISTRAGSLGINLVGASRVIIFDASWNPCHDTQAVYRIYRYGQTKPCFVYRFVMDKCLEKKIYDRQIKKQGMSDRVVDECNPDAHFSIKDITNLCHDYEDQDKSASESPNFEDAVHTYTDAVIQQVVNDLKHCLSKAPFLHESLLIDRKEKKLSQAEKRQAQRGYEMEKKAVTRNAITYSKNIQYQFVREDGSVLNKPVASIRPLQTTTTQMGTKSSPRTTRWIPAEVWQRQGMTAQEMILPLDVVIPTNSSEKSNITLKSGQRVMVLKSSKGIYMQLDSGKIIAIRTSSKPPATTATTSTTPTTTTTATTTPTTTAKKSTKEDIIDITSDGDSIPEMKNETSSANAVPEKAFSTDKNTRCDTKESSIKYEKFDSHLVSTTKSEEICGSTNEKDFKKNAIKPPECIQKSQKLIPKEEVDSGPPARNQIKNSVNSTDGTLSKTQQTLNAADSDSRLMNSRGNINDQRDPNRTATKRSSYDYTSPEFNATRISSKDGAMPSAERVQKALVLPNVLSNKDKHINSTVNADVHPRLPVQEHFLPTNSYNYVNHHYGCLPIAEQQSQDQKLNFYVPNYNMYHPQVPNPGASLQPQQHQHQQHQHQHHQHQPHHQQHSAIMNPQKIENHFPPAPTNYAHQHQHQLGNTGYNSENPLNVNECQPYDFYNRRYQPPPPHYHHHSNLPEPMSTDPYQMHCAPLIPSMMRPEQYNNSFTTSSTDYPMNHWPQDKNY